jgi:general stress protein 26
MTVREKVLSCIGGETTMVGYLATLTVDGAPTVRPVTLLIDGTKFYMKTIGTSDKAAQIKQDPRVEVVIPLKDERGNGYLRVGGRARLVSDIDERKRVMSASGFEPPDSYDDLDDADFMLYALEAERERFLEPGEWSEVEVNK